MSNTRTQKTQDQDNDNEHPKKEKENDQALEQIDNDNALIDSSDDFDDEAFQRRVDRRRKYKKKKYEENKEKIKQQYDPAKRREKYQKEKVAKQNVEKKIVDAIRNEEVDELDEDEEVARFLNRQENESLYQKNWYKENSKKMKEQYDPVKRKEKGQKERATKVERREEIDKGDIDELYGDKSFRKFMNRETKEKERKKAWYKKNADRIKAKRKASYNRIQKFEENKVQKSKRDKRHKIEADTQEKKYCILGWGHSDSKGKDDESREQNLISKNKTLERYYCGTKKMKIFELDQDSHFQIFALKLAIEDLFKEIENETCKVKRIALDFAKTAEISVLDINDLYEVLMLQRCEKWHALQLRIDTEFHEIAASIGKSFNSDGDPDYIIECERNFYKKKCNNYGYGHNHKKLSNLQKYLLNYNRWEKHNTWYVLRIGFGKTKNLSLLQEQSQIVHDLKVQVHDQYEKIETAISGNQICNILDSEEEMKHKKYGVSRKNREKYWTEKIIEKWRKLRNNIINEFKTICHHFGKTFDIEDDKDCLEKCQLCIEYNIDTCISTYLYSRKYI